MLWRPGALVCLVHRPRYDDWSLPKGKLKRGEHPLAAAVREVAEETGVRGIPQQRLPTVRYRLSDGTCKTVHYWSVKATDESPAKTDDEVDEVAWLPVDEAVARLSYRADAEVLRAWWPASYALPIVRHATAGKRDAHWGDDDARPLDAEGRAQAATLTPLLALFRPERLLAAAPRRCRQTLAHLADLLDLPIEVNSRFDEPRPGQTCDERAAVAAARVLELVDAGVPVVVCSQGKVIPQMLARLAGGTRHDYRTPKGAGWVLTFVDRRLTAVDPLL